MLVAPLHTAAARVQAAFRGKRTRDRVNIRRAPRQGAGQVDGAPEAAGSMQGASGNEAQQKTEALCPGARRASGHSASPWGGSASWGRMAQPGFGMPSLPKPSKQYLKKKQKQFTFHSPCASLYHNHVARKSFMPKVLSALYPSARVLSQRSPYRRVVVVRPSGDGRRCGDAFVDQDGREQAGEHHSYRAA